MHTEISQHRDFVVRADRLLDRWAVEDRTSLDITTIYRKIKAGTFPSPVQVGRRRVAWRESDIAEWQQGLDAGVRASQGSPRPGPARAERLGTAPREDGGGQ